MFMPGKPGYGTWIFSLARTTTQAVKRAGAGGHKEINRTNLSAARIEELMKTDIVKEQLKPSAFQKRIQSIGFDLDLAVSTEGETITIHFLWMHGQKRNTACKSEDL